MDPVRKSRESKENSTHAGSEGSHSDNGIDKSAAYGDGRNGGRFRSKRAIVALLLLCIVVLALALGLGLGLGLKHSAPSKGVQGQTEKPNVLVIMTDDQDMLLDSMQAMPNVNKLLGDGGVRYEKHYCTVAWCCPSRVNFLTGRAAHNTNVTSTMAPYGGWFKFAEQGLNDNYLPVWINKTGIGTYYVGKFLNGFSHHNYDKPAHPSAWTMSDMLLDPYTYYYYKSRWIEGYTDNIVGYPGVHTTDVTQMKALNMIDKAAASGNQFFMMVTPVAPHQEMEDGARAPPVPDGFKTQFADAKAPRTENFNPEKRSGASWVYNAPRLDTKQLGICDNTYNHRLGNIAAIDQMIQNFADRLEYHGILDNTYIIFTSDNGFHIGNHRLMPGKRCPYEEDVNIPLLIKGPDVPKGVNSTITNSHTDMAPTILKMLGVPLQDEFDGAPIAYTKEDLSNSTKSEIVTVEFWDGAAGAPIGVKAHLYYNNTYKALRMMTPDHSLYYSHWCTGQREFYDMLSDSQQMHNLLGDGATPPSSTTYYGRSQADLLDRLDAVLMVTKSCKQEACRNPWGVLFPSGSVTTLEQAMSSRYDSFFAAQPKVQFESCTPGFLPQKEKPFYVTAYGSQKKVYPGSILG